MYSYHKHHETAIKLRERFLPTAKEHMTDHPSVGTLYEELGSSYEALGNAEKSMDCRKEAIRIYEGFLGDHKFTATSYLGLGTTLKSQGKFLIGCTFASYACYLSLKFPRFHFAHPKCCIFARIIFCVNPRAKDNPRKR